MDRTEIKLKLLRDLMGMAKAADGKRLASHVDADKKSKMHPLLEAVGKPADEEGHVPEGELTDLGEGEESPGEVHEETTLVETKEPKGQEMKDFKPAGEDKAGEVGAQLAKHEASDEEFEKEMDKRFRSRRK